MQSVQDSKKDSKKTKCKKFARVVQQHDYYIASLHRWPMIISIALILLTMSMQC